MHFSNDCGMYEFALRTKNLSHFGCLLHKLQVEMTDVAEFKLCDKLERKLFGN